MSASGENIIAIHSPTMRPIIRNAQKKNAHAATRFTATPRTRIKNAAVADSPPFKVRRLTVSLENIFK
jgi:hypothetical protein